MATEKSDSTRAQSKNKATSRTESRSDKTISRSESRSDKLLIRDPQQASDLEVTVQVLVPSLSPQTDDLCHFLVAMNNKAIVSNCASSMFSQNACVFGLQLDWKELRSNHESLVQLLHTAEASLSQRKF